MRIPDKVVLYDSVTGIPLPLEMFRDHEDGTAPDDLALEFVADAERHFNVDDVRKVSGPDLTAYQYEWFAARRRATRS
jgi:hypothetical protein